MACRSRRFEKRAKPTCVHAIRKRIFACQLEAGPELGTMVLDLETMNETAAGDRAIGSAYIFIQ